MFSSPFKGEELKEGVHLRETFLPFSLPLIGEEEIAEVVDSMRSGWITTGPKTKEFGKRFAETVGVKYAVPVNSCTAALHLSLLALGIGPGDEVITSPFTFCATANVIVHTGATPVFADIRSDTFNIDSEQLKARIGPKTKAIIAVHYGGHPADMEDINGLAHEHDLKVIEDVAHAPFASYKGWMTGAMGDTGCFSFYATKNMTTAEGGMLTTNIEDVAVKAKSLSLHGLSDDAWDRYTDQGSWFYQVIYPGFKYNMTDIQAAMGLHQLDRANAFLKRREEIAGAYDDAFGPMPELDIPYTRETVKNVRHLYTILLKPDTLDIDRADFIKRLNGLNIGTSVHFIPVHLHPYYKDTFGFKDGDYPVTESVYNRIISLPIYPKMSDADAQDVIEAVKTVVERHRI